MFYNRSVEEIIIVGSGPAGYTAGIYAARAGLNPLIIAGPLPGGQLTNTTEIENWPGDPEQLMGPALMERMKQHCSNLGVRLVSQSVQAVNFSKHPFTLQSDKEEFLAKSVILATGASPLMLDLADEQSYMGRGLSSCATCDGFFFKNQEVAVVGGGNVAVEDALFLSNLASKVFLIHRRDQLRAEKILQDKLFKAVDAGKVEIIWDSQMISYVGNETGITGATIQQNTHSSHKSNNKSEERKLDVAGIFIAIGHTPNSEFLGKEVEFSNGYVKLNNQLGANFTATSVAGVFAAGDIADHHYRQAITSAGMGCMAALDANNFLQGLA